MPNHNHTISTGVSASIILALATLAAALPQAASAQSLTLQSGDSVTVSGAGTVGTLGGLPVTGGPSSYSNGTGSGNFYAAETNGTATFTLGAGGSLSGTGVTPSTGNTGYGLVAQGSGLVTVSGGTVTGGQYSGGLLAKGTGPVLITGGTINSGQYGIALIAQTSASFITIAGGTINKGAGGSAGLSDGLGAEFGGTIDLFSQGGSAFYINNVPLNNTSLQGYTSGTDTLSGTLLNGDRISTTFEAFDGGTIELNIGTPPTVAAPEPSPTAGLGLGVLGLAGLALKARKRQSA